MADLEDFEARVARTQNKANSRREDSAGDRVAKGVFEFLLDFVTDILFFGWWSVLMSFAFFIFATLAILNFIGFDLEYLVAASLVFMVALALAWHLWES